MKIQILRKKSEKLAELLLFNEHALLMRRSKISIHSETGNIFFEKKKALVRAFTISFKHKKIRQKLLKTNLTFAADCVSYISEYLMLIKAIDKMTISMIC